jgi:hypothetical protein
MSDKTRDLESLLLEQAERDHDDEMDLDKSGWYNSLKLTER